MGRKKYSITIRPIANDFEPDSLSISINGNLQSGKKIQRESLNGKTFYVISYFSFSKGDTVIVNIRRMNLSVLDTLLLQDEKLSI
jgi:hypothetical protein